MWEMAYRFIRHQDMLDELIDGIPNPENCPVLWPVEKSIPPDWEEVEVVILGTES